MELKRAVVIWRSMARVLADFIIGNCQMAQSNWLL